MITEYGRSTIQYIQNNLQVEAIGAVIVIGLILWIIISCIFLALRRVRLWYWDINRQVTTLENIEKNLEEIKHNFPHAKEEAQVIPEEQAAGRPTASLTESGREESDQAENRQNQEGEKPLSETAASAGPAVIKPGYNIGKTGNVYTEETLREQIQF